MLPTDAKARKAYPILKFLTEYFPDAVLAKVRVAVAGNKQHNPELDPADIKWSRGKSPDHLEAAMRHIWDHLTVGPLDTDGEYHLAKAGWRIDAATQLQIEADSNRGVPCNPVYGCAIPVHDEPEGHVDWARVIRG